MNHFDEYIRESEPHKKEKGYLWQTAIGFQAVDGLKLSDYLMETARKHVKVDITIDEVKELVDSYYKSKDVCTSDVDEIENVDIISINISKRLSEKNDFCNLLLGERNELKNGYLIIHVPEELPDNKENQTSSVQVIIELTEQVQDLLLAIDREQFTLKQLLEK